MVYGVIWYTDIPNYGTRTILLIWHLPTQNRKAQQVRATLSRFVFALLILRVAILHEH